MWQGLRALLAKGEADVLCQLSAYRHTPDEYAGAFAFILDGERCREREHLVVQSMQRVEVSAANPKPT